MVLDTRDCIYICAVLFKLDTDILNALPDDIRDEIQSAYKTTETLSANVDTSKASLSAVNNAEVCVDKFIMQIQCNN